MEFFISNAYAQGAQQGDAFSFLLPMLIIFGAFYFLLIRPQQKRQKAHAALVGALKTGDEVMTAGGILGLVTGVSDHYATLKIADNVEIKVQKSTVSAVVPKGTIDAA
ncbi:preprotein translocase subunit YajC [Woeseia oceani]|uniref:Sec translocon accessory complex subunit YajC n=1 Tax=Woeseia oceani TaxID=1548547 RepID=A0A193LEB0_9GAMM|nr:preprotein translocase subunit YajC [Woeseia oceani]ANO50803.1 preprotein translocase subunit YajC [Woeseia oceani]